ncbi:hypothetical protein ACQZV8_16480, partial [Magnetococcales bacterium HHB-1]
LLRFRGFGIIKKPVVWKTAILFIILLIPLIIITLKFGQKNLSSTVGERPWDASLFSLEAWIYYFRQLPHQLGKIHLWPIIGGILGMLIFPSWRLPKQDRQFFLIWFICGYLFFTLISLREPRHNLAILFPLSIFAALFFQRTIQMISKRKEIWGIILALLLALWCAKENYFNRYVPSVKGYNQAAQQIAKVAEKNSMVLFSGNRDGSFIFNMRVNTPRRDLHIVRSDKLFLRIAIERERGFQDRGYSKQKILDLLNKYGIRYVVAQKDFWIDTPSMATLQNLLQDNTHFEKITEIPVQANYAFARDKMLWIYRNRHNPLPPESIAIDMVGINRSFKRKMSHQ